jgi:hypothetical protein
MKIVFLNNAIDIQYFRANTKKIPQFKGAVNTYFKKINKDISQILSSRTLFLVLQLLSLRKNGLGLREIEFYTNLNIQSVQRAVKNLHNKKVIKKNSFNLYTLNKNAPLASQRIGIFQFLENEEIKNRSKLYSHRAPLVIQLCEEIKNIVLNSRKSLETN